jgi:hypothetical protein
MELLFRALIACRSTMEAKKEVYDRLVGVDNQNRKQEPKMRNVVIEVLKIFGPGECRFHAETVFGK